ncbi:hypothetical protein [Jiangella gansuensis]|uniref:hypothetical protein n=1 Tax=Jiangella gansuensis TaxID=281473 RepID=UPI0004B83AFB|nr:hypothetical protein [Jiangella gansuensis]
MTSSRLESVRDYLWVPVPILAFPAAALYLFLALLHLAFGGELKEECIYFGAPSGAHFVRMRESILPLERTCVFADGSTQESVPDWLNPVVFGAVAVAALCFMTAVLLSRHLNRRATG